RVLQCVSVSNPAGPTLAKAASEDRYVPIAGHNALEGLIHIYAKLVAVAGKYRLPLRSLSGNPGDEIRYLLSLTVLGRGPQDRPWPLSLYPAGVEALELSCDLVLPPADLHPGAGVSTKRPEANLSLLPLKAGKEEVLRGPHTIKRRFTDLRKYAGITRLQVGFQPLP